MSRETIIGHAANLVTRIRASVAINHDVLVWQTPGVAKAIRDTPGPLGLVIAAAFIAAEDTSLEKPSVKAFLMHWPVNASTTPEAPHEATCGEHHMSLPCKACEDAAAVNPVDPTVLAPILAQTRAEIASHKTPPKPRRQPDVEADRAAALEAARARIAQEATP